MSYIYNKEMKFTDSPQMDAFGRLRTSSLTSIMEVKHVHDKQPLLIDEVIGGTGATSIYMPGNSDVEMDVSINGDYVIRATKARGIYQPGKSALFEATMMNFHKQAGVTKRLGYFSTTTTGPYDSGFDGIFLQSCGITGGTGSGVYQNEGISLQIWKSGTKTYDAPLASWDDSVIDPVTDIDWQKDQLFWFDFQWLGVGRVRWGLYLENHSQLQLGEFVGANIIEDPYMTSPNQPIRYEIRSSGGAGEFHQLCSTFIVEGSLNALNKNVGIYTNAEKQFTTVGSKYPLMGYRIQGSYPGANVFAESISSLSTLSSHDFLATLEINPVLGPSASPTWNSVNNTPIEYAMGFGATGTTGDVIATEGHVISSWIIKGGSTTSTDNVNLSENILRPGIDINGVQDEVWICVTPITTSSSKIKMAVINLQYFD
jgi:hypothetical protein